MRCWETMRRIEPQFMIHGGDSIYADGPLRPEVPLPDGTIWKHVVASAGARHRRGGRTGARSRASAPSADGPPRAEFDARGAPVVLSSS
jgi:hypothetical protein